jgi:hypothetical protein
VSSVSINVVRAAQVGTADLQITAPTRTDSDDPLNNQFRSQWAFPVVNNGPGDAVDLRFAVLYLPPLRNPRFVPGNAIADALLCVDTPNIPSFTDQNGNSVFAPTPTMRAFSCAMTPTEYLQAQQSATFTVLFDRGGNAETPQAAIGPSGTPPRSPDPNLQNNAITTPAFTEPSQTFTPKCFIATAAFGTPMAPEVQILRDFRDRVLLHFAAGRRFVEWYYQNSPPLADYIKDRPRLRALVRALLRPVIFIVGNPGGAAALFGSVVLLFGGLRRRKQRRV